MPHIKLPEGLPGIRGAMAYRPETAKPLNELAEILLHQPHSLPAGERELIATYVSYLNDCYFCQTAHGAIAAAHLNDDEELVKRVKADFRHGDIPAKLKALLVIASKVQKGGKHVTAEDSVLLPSSLFHHLCRIVSSSSGERRRESLAEAPDPDGSQNGSTEMRW